MLLKSIVFITIVFTSISVEAIIQGNLTSSAGYLAPFAADNAIEDPFELIEDAIDEKGRTVSLRKRGDDCQKYHKVVRGDNCYTLSLRYNVDESSIHKWNTQINAHCSNLYPGKSYCVQKSNASIVQEDKCIQTYTVKSIDTCISIAKYHGLSLNEFYSMNPSVNRKTCNNLLTGGHYCVKKTKAVKVSTRTTKTKAMSDRFSILKKVKKSSSRRAKKTSKKFVSRKKTTTTTKESMITSSSNSNKIKASKPKKEQRKLLQKGAELTYYWIAHPDDYKNGGKSITIKTCSGSALGTVSQEYADALVMEGTGVVGNKIVNLGGCSCSNYDCFMEVDKEEDPYGLTSYGSALRPFITIAANDIKRNTKIYVPKLDGWDIPGSSKKHNGCLLVDDQSWSFEDNHIDFYVYREKNYRSLNSEHGVNSVDIYEGGDCHLLNYIYFK